MRAPKEVNVRMLMKSLAFVPKVTKARSINTALSVFSVTLRYASEIAFGRLGVTNAQTS